MPDPFLTHNEPPPYEQNDKRMHSLVGGALRLAGDEDTPRWLTLMAPAAAGVAKEALDGMDRGNHTPSWQDAAATALGGALAYRNPRHGLTVVPTISEDLVALDLILKW